LYEFYIDYDDKVDDEVDDVDDDLILRLKNVKFIKK